MIGIWELKIGLPRYQEGLYYLPAHENNKQNIQKIDNSYAGIVSKRITAKEKAWLLHCRLEHPSIQTLRLMLPTVFKDIKVDNLVSEIYERAKNRKCSYPTKSTERKDTPFNLIHCDVWGPAPSPDIHGFR